MPKSSSKLEPQLVVFDLDDTLYAERDYVRSALQFAGTQVDRLFACEGSADFLHAAFADGLADPLDYLWQDRGLPSCGREQVVAAMRAHMPSISLYSDARLFLDEMRARHQPFAIITDGRSVTQRAKIASLNCFDAVAISVSEEVGLSKLDEERFALLERAAPARRYLYVADNPAKDFLMPNSRGWTTFMLKDRGANVHSQNIVVDPDYRAQHVIGGFAELGRFLK